MPSALPSSYAIESRWAILFLVVAVRVAVTLQQQSVGALGPLLIADPLLDMGYTGLGALIGAYMLPGAFVALPAGWLTGHLGERRMLLIGLAIVLGGGVAFAFAPTFSSAFAARLVTGAGAALLSVVLSTLLMARFSGPSLGLAMGVFLASFPFGIGLTLVVLPVVATAFASWRAAILVAAIGCAIALFALPFCLRRAPATDAPASPEERRQLLRREEWWPLLTVSIAWLAANVGYVVMLNFAPALLVERGMSPATAGALTSIATWASIPLAPFGGVIAGWTGRPVLTASFCVAGAAVATLGLALGWGPESLNFLVAGLLMGVGATVIMTLPAQALAPESRSFGMGVFYTIFFGGMAVFPPIAGGAADTAGDVAVALGVAAAGLLVCVAFIGAFQWMRLNVVSGGQVRGS